MQPIITHNPTNKGTSNSKTITDNIFSNIISTGIISGNLTATISDHLPQFLIAPKIFRNSPSNKFNYFERDWSNFNQENFILDYFSVNWKNIMNLQKKNDVNHSLQCFFDSMNDLLKIHAPDKKVKNINLNSKKNLGLVPVYKIYFIKKLSFQEIN